MDSFYKCTGNISGGAAVISNPDLVVGAAREDWGMEVMLTQQAS
jgi:hypothetical protein